MAAKPQNQSPQVIYWSNSLNSTNLKKYLVLNKYGHKRITFKCISAILLTGFLEIWSNIKLFTELELIMKYYDRRWHLR